ncbi:hypothetical protein NDA16_004549 [Ustilago loliicola]|nr:hypothetical protein NDA16_004549 [Ustilago loliicola]
MSFAPLPLAVPSSGASSIWARRMITKSVPTSDDEVELNVLSLLLDVPLASLDEQDLASSPVSLHGFSSPWAIPPAPASAGFHMARSSSPFGAPIQRSKSMGYFNNPDHLEMHTAQTAVKAALDVLEEPTLSRGLRISTATASAGLGRGCLTAPLSPASPVSPAESCFSAGEGEGKKKGRARMSQEKRKRLARRREREALVAALTQPAQQGLLLTQHQADEQFFSHSAPVTPMRSSFPSASGFAGFPFGGYEAFSTPLSSPRSTLGFDLPSPALTTATVSSGFGSIGTPSSSPTALAPLGGEASSPPTLVVQPPSPQRIRIVGNRAPIKAPSSTNKTAAHGLWNTTHLASVY